MNAFKMKKSIVFNFATCIKSGHEAFRERIFDHAVGGLLSFEARATHSMVLMPPMEFPN